MYVSSVAPLRRPRSTPRSRAISEPPQRALRRFGELAVKIHTSTPRDLRSVGRRARAKALRRFRKARRNPFYSQPIQLILRVDPVLGLEPRAVRLRFSPNSSTLHALRTWLQCCHVKSLVDKGAIDIYSDREPTFPNAALAKTRFRIERSLSSRRAALPYCARSALCTPPF